MSIKLTYQDYEGGKSRPSCMTRQFKTFEELEKDMQSGWGGGMIYTAQLGAVKRKYKKVGRVWERVLHPRGTKKKKKVAVKCEFQDDYRTPINETTRWLDSAYKAEELDPFLGTDMSKNVWHNHRITYSDGSVAYYTHNGDNILRKFDKLPEWHTKSKETPSESAEVKQAPKPVSHELFDKRTNSWRPGAWRYDTLLQLVAEGEPISPTSYPYRVTFDDGSVTYFTRDKIGDPLVERKTLDQPIQSPVVLCSIDDFYSVPAKTKLITDGYLYTYPASDAWVTQEQFDRAETRYDLPQGWIEFQPKTIDQLECVGKFIVVKNGKFTYKMEVTKV